MVNPTKEPSAFVTGSDEKYVFVWSSDHPLEELRFPLKMDSERPQPGQKVQYVCTRPLSEVQYGAVLKKVDNPLPVIIQRDGGDFLVVAHVGFPPPGSNYCLRELAVADDYHIRVYCHSVELGTVVSFRNLDSDWQKIYQVHLKRFPKHCDWMIPKVSTMWHICNMQEVTDSARAAQISSLMPWNNSFFYDGYDIDANMIPLKSMAGLSVMDSDFDENSTILHQSTSQRPLMSSTDCALPQNPANLYQSTSSHMAMSSAERFPLINIDDNSAQQTGLLIATLLSKTPQNRTWEAVQLKRTIFEMCANLQNELMGGNFSTRSNQNGHPVNRNRDGRIDNGRLFTRRNGSLSSDPSGRRPSYSRQQDSGRAFVPSTAVIQRPISPTGADNGGMYLMVDPFNIPNTLGPHIQVFDLQEGIRHIIGYCIPMRCCVGLFKHIQPCRAIKSMDSPSMDEQFAHKYKFHPNLPLSVVPLHDAEFHTMMCSPAMPLRDGYHQRNRFFVRPTSQRLAQQQRHEFDDTAMHFVQGKFKLHLNQHLIAYRLPDGLDCYLRLELAPHCQNDVTAQDHPAEHSAHVNQYRRFRNNSSLREEEQMNRRGLMSTSLDSGLRIATLPTYGQFATIGVAISAGSRNEVHYPAGTAHFLEKISFSSSQHFPDKAHTLDLLEKFGALVDCQSTRDTFVYAASCRIESAFDLLAIIADAVQRPNILDEEVEYCRDVIRYENETLSRQPECEPLLNDWIHQAAFRSNTVGLSRYCPSELVEAVHSKHILSFLSQYYKPQSIVLAGVGVDQSWLVDVGKELFDPRKTTWNERPERLLTDLPPADESVAQYTGGEVLIEKDLSQMALAPLRFQIWHTLSSDLRVLVWTTQIFAGGPGKGMYTRLYVDVLNQNHWIYNATAFNHSYKDCGLFCIRASADPSKLKDMVDVILAEFRRLCAGVRQGELERAKDLARQMLAHGQRKTADEYSELIDRVQDKDIVRIAHKMLDSRLSIVGYGDLRRMPTYKNIQSML
uniref:Mitochondrial-processing peptidase subunit alpha n=1 Tax=Globodera pallida TaxID=36090 RepID=A0A183C0W5_GLOPA